MQVRRAVCLRWLGELSSRRPLRAAQWTSWKMAREKRGIAVDGNINTVSLQSATHLQWGMTGQNEEGRASRIDPAEMGRSMLRPYGWIEVAYSFCWTSRMQVSSVSTAKSACSSSITKG